MATSTTLRGSAIVSVVGLISLCGCSQLSLTDFANLREGMTSAEARQTLGRDPEQTLDLVLEEWLSEPRSTVLVYPASNVGLGRRYLLAFLDDELYVWGYPRELFFSQYAMGQYIGQLAANQLNRLETCRSRGTMQHDARAPLSLDDAFDAIWRLPEIQAWADHIDEVSGGKKRGGLDSSGEEVELPGAPGANESYYKVTFRESFVDVGGDTTHRWETFLVGRQSGEVLVDTPEHGLLFLYRWRMVCDPMGRVGKQQR